MKFPVFFVLSSCHFTLTTVKNGIRPEESSILKLPVQVRIAENRSKTDALTYIRTTLLMTRWIKESGKEIRDHTAESSTNNGEQNYGNTTLHTHKNASDPLVNDASCPSCKLSYTGIESGSVGDDHSMRKSLLNILSPSISSSRQSNTKRRKLSANNNDIPHFKNSHFSGDSNHFQKAPSSRMKFENMLEEHILEQSTVSSISIDTTAVSKSDKTLTLDYNKEFIPNQIDGNDKGFIDIRKRGQDNIIPTIRFEYSPHVGANNSSLNNSNSPLYVINTPITPDLKIADTSGNLTTQIQKIPTKSTFGDITQTPSNHSKSIFPTQARSTQIAISNPTAIRQGLPPNRTHGLVSQDAQPNVTITTLNQPTHSDNRQRNSTVITILRRTFPSKINSTLTPYLNTRQTTTRQPIFPNTNQRLTTHSSTINLSQTIIRQTLLHNVTKSFTNLSASIGTAHTTLQQNALHRVTPTTHNLDETNTNETHTTNLAESQNLSASITSQEQRTMRTRLINIISSSIPQHADFFSPTIQQNVRIQQRSMTNSFDISTNANHDVKSTTDITAASTGESTSQVLNTSQVHQGKRHPVVELDLNMSWADFCFMELAFRQELTRILHKERELSGISEDQICILNAKSNCLSKSYIITDTIRLQLCILNKQRLPNIRMTLLLDKLIKSGGQLSGGSVIADKMTNVLLLLLIKSENHSATPKEEEDEEESREQDGSKNPRLIGVISIVAVGACCCVTLIVLQYLWRKRHRETPIRMTRTENRVHKTSITKENRSFSISSADSAQMKSINEGCSIPSNVFHNLAFNCSDTLEISNALRMEKLAEFCLDERKIHREYEKIPNRLPRLSVVPAGEEDKNRYANILPLPQTRVKLIQDDVNSRRSSYINASYVTGPNCECQYYIATQAPTDNTICDFWTMVWQQKSNTIIMLTQLEENGQSKCAAYWPDLTGKSATQRHGNFQVELKQKFVNQEYIVSKLELNHLRKIETRTVYHYWYTCWPTKGVPEPISLVKLILDCRPKYESGKSPLVVHCSPGTGRTCTYIGLDLCMRQFETQRIVDVLKVVNTMRHERAGAIQNKDQYTLIYEALNDYTKIVSSCTVSTASSATTLHALLPG